MVRRKPACRHAEFKSHTSAWQPNVTIRAKPNPAGRRPGTEAKLFETDNDDPRDKYYVLEMFPYPSGRIHMGHVRNYAMGDVVARYQARPRLQRAASDGLGRLRHAGRKCRDAEQGPSQGNGPTHNIATMREQLKSMGLSLDWSREFATCDVEYYQPPAAPVPRFPGKGPGLSQAVQGQLGSGRHDRARQRAGHRRPRLALRRAGRAARTDAVVLQDHRLSPGPARRARRPRSNGRKRSG